MGEPTVVRCPDMATVGRVIVRIAAVIEAVEGIGLVGFGVFVGLGIPRGGTVLQSTALAAVIAIMGLAAVLVGFGLDRRRRWSRGPAVVTQLIAIPIGVSLIRSGWLPLGLPLVFVAVSGLVLLFSPQLARTIYGD